MTKEAQLLIDRYEKLIERRYWDTVNYMSFEEFKIAVEEKIKEIIIDQEKKEKNERNNISNANTGESNSPKENY